MVGKNACCNFCPQICWDLFCDLSWRTFHVHIMYSTFLQCSVLKLSIKSICSIMLSKTTLLTDFLSDDLHWRKWGLKVPSVIVLLLISPFMFVNICFMYFGAPIIAVCMLMSVIFSSCIDPIIIISSVQSLSRVWLCDPMNHSTPASLSITISWSSLKLMSIELLMPLSHLILCRPLLFLPSIFPGIRIFSSESSLRISTGASTSASVLAVNIQGWSPLGWTGWISLLSKGLSRSSPAPQFKSINSLVFSLLNGSTLTSIHD